MSNSRNTNNNDDFILGSNTLLQRQHLDSIVKIISFSIAGVHDLYKNKDVSEIINKSQKNHCVNIHNDILFFSCIFKNQLEQKYLYPGYKILQLENINIIDKIKELFSDLVFADYDMENLSETFDEKNHIQQQIMIFLSYNTLIEILFQDSIANPICITLLTITVYNDIESM
eukprot:255437_1